MTLEQQDAAILAGNTHVIGVLADAMRARGSRHADVVAAVQAVFTRAGKEPPECGQIDVWLDEADEAQLIAAAFPDCVCRSCLSTTRKTS